MALDFQPVDITFTKGLDTRSQRKLVVPGRWDKLVNVSLSENGAVQRRDGFEALVDGQTGNGLATHNSQLLVIDGPEVSTVANAGTGSTAVAVSGLVGNVGVSKTEVFRQDGVQDQPDCAYGNGLICQVWRQNSFLGSALSIQGVRCTIIDAETGAHVLDNATVDATVGVGDRAVCPRVVFADNAFFIFYIVGTGASTALTCRVIDATSPTTAQTIGAAVALVTSASLMRENFDACMFPTDAEATVLYRWNDGSASARAIVVGQALTVPSVVNGPDDIFSEPVTPAADMVALAVCAFEPPSYVGFFSLSVSAGLVGCVFDDSFNIVSGESVVNPAATPTTTAPTHLCACVDGSNLRVFWDFQSEWGTNAISQLGAQVLTSALGTFAGPTDVIAEATFGGVGNPRGPQGPFVYGKPFASGGRIYLPVCVMEDYAGLTSGACVNVNTQNAVFLLDTGPTASNISSGVIVAKALYQTFGVPQINGATPAVSTPCSVAETTADTFAMPAMERTTLTLFDGINYSPTGLVSLSFAPNFSLPPATTQLGETTYIEGGQLCAYDGVAVTEVGYPLFPEGLIVAATAGGACTAGAHAICATYDWSDSSGNNVRSSPSPVVEVTTGGGNNTAQVRVPTLLLSQKPNVTISLWMTAVGGTSFHLASKLNTNDTTVPFVTLNISTSDATLTGNALLDAQPLQAGTTLANIAPGPMHGIAVSQSRLWGFLSDEPLQYVFSQELLPNTGLQFNNDELKGTLPADSGGGVAISELDEKTILFGERKIYAVYGTGPSPSGSNNNFSTPQEIPSDVGCSDARSVLAMPQGLMFKSPKGFYLLGRDLSVRYIGDGAQEWNSSEITCALLCEDRQECRFGINDSSKPGFLVYSYLADAWSIYYMGNTLHPGSVVDAVWWSATDRMVHLQPAGATFPGLMQDTPGVYVDGAGTASPLQGLIYARTGWLHVSTLESFQRVRRLYLTATAPDDAPDTSLVISVDFDDMYDAAAPGAYTVTEDLSLITTFDSGSAIDLRHRLARQKCKSVAFTFLEGGGATYTATPLTGLQVMALEIGRKRGLNKLSAAQTAG